MTQFTNATFSVHGKHCNGCSQRDVWIQQRDETIEIFRAALDSAQERIDKLETALSGRTYFHDNEAVEAKCKELEVRPKVISLRGGNTLTGCDIHGLEREGIDNEAIVILYNSTHDRVQKLLLAELTAIRGISLIEDPSAA